MFFSNENRERVKEENPGCSFGDVGKFLGEEWRGLSSSEKKVYEKSAATKGTIRDALKVRSGARLGRASPLR